MSHCTDKVTYTFFTQLVCPMRWTILIVQSSHYPTPVGTGWYSKRKENFFKPQPSAEEGMNARQGKTTDTYLFTEIWSLKREKNGLVSVSQWLSIYL